MVCYHRTSDNDPDLAVVGPDKLHHFVDGHVHHVEGRRNRDAQRVAVEVFDQQVFFLLEQVYVPGFEPPPLEKVRQISSSEAGDVARLELLPVR